VRALSARPLWKAASTLSGVGMTTSAIRALRRTRELTAEPVNRAAEPIGFVGWQRPQLPGRVLTADAPPDAAFPEPQVLPAVEVRLMRAGGSLKLAGF